MSRLNSMGGAYHTPLVPPVPVPATWQEGYDIARLTGDFAPADAWFDAHTGRTSTNPLLDLGGQVAVTSSFLTTQAVSNPANVFQEGGRWILQDIMCANFRITSTSGALPLTFRQCYLPRRGNTYIYAFHSPTTSPVHDIILEDSTFDGEDEPTGAYAVYMPANDYIDDDTIVRRCKFTGFQSCVRGVYGTTMEECLISDLFYFPESHNTAASFRGGHSHVRRNRVRPGATGSSGINFYAEVSPGDSPTGYDFLTFTENLIHAPNAIVAVNFPDEDDPSILFSDPFVGMTRRAQGNIVDTRFSNPLNWVIPGEAVGSIVSGSGIADNIHWDLSDADDGSLPA